jgi:LmbE family N-acetylglucosaminyl deacetylase
MKFIAFVAAVLIVPAASAVADSIDLNGVDSAQALRRDREDGGYVMISISDDCYSTQGPAGGVGLQLEETSYPSSALPLAPDGEAPAEIDFTGSAPLSSCKHSGVGEIRYPDGASPGLVPGKAWLMAVHAHPDDEGIFFGGVLPYYACTLGLPVVLVNMTTGWLEADCAQTEDSYTRQAELTEAAGRYGLDGAPMFLLFQQTDWNIGIENSWDRWADCVTDGDDIAEGQRRASRCLAELIRAYRPEVIVTHDFAGEYGHPDHKALAYATAAAWDLAAGRDAVIDDGVTPRIIVRADGVTGEPWEARKLYIHSYDQGRLFHDHWENISVDSDGDGTADQTPRQIANYALGAHESQGRVYVVTVYDTLANGGNTLDNHPSEFWGLHASTVGPDSQVADFVVEGRTYSGWARGDFTENVHVPAAKGCSVDVAALDFGTLAVGETATREFVVRNRGLDVLSGTVVLAGSGCGDFRIAAGTESYELAWGDTHTVTVKFRPRSASDDFDCWIDTGNEYCGLIPLSGKVSEIPDLLGGARLSVHPNPFTPRLQIAFILDRKQRAEISVYDLTGRRLAVLADRSYGAGDHTLVWDGRDADGDQVSSGTYLIRLETKSGILVEKVMLVR